MNQTDLINKNRRAGLILLAVIAAMTVLAFASVPLYRMFCAATGFNGSAVTTASALPTKILKRQISIRFNADVAPGMKWDFKPEKPEIKIHLGQKGLIAFQAHNRSDKPSAGAALYNINPAKAGRYFHKIQCFCFNQQYLAPNQRADLPVVFYVDPSMNDNPDMEDVDSITLSYTFFPVDSKSLDAALQRFYNGGASPKKAAR